MSATIYIIGLSAHGACSVCADLQELFRVAGKLAPGSYWIQEIREQDLDDLFEEFESASMEADWGTLEVRGTGDWTLRSIAGLLAGPGYVVV